MKLKEAITLIKESEKTNCMVWTAGTRPLIINTSKENLLEALQMSLDLYPADDRYEVECHEGKDFFSIQEINKP